MEKKNTQVPSLGMYDWEKDSSREFA